MTIFVILLLEKKTQKMAFLYLGKIQTRDTKVYNNIMMVWFILLTARCCILL